MKDNIIYQFNPDGPNIVTDELSSTSFMCLREVRWTEDGEYHPDFRRYFIKPDGSEMPGKGTAIPNPDSLLSALLTANYGNTEQCVSNLWERDDFIPAIASKVASYDEEQYEEFKSNLDEERIKAIEKRGAIMSSNEFMENL